MITRSQRKRKGRDEADKETEMTMLQQVEKWSPGKSHYISFENANDRIDTFGPAPVCIAPGRVIKIPKEVEPLPLFNYPLKDSDMVDCASCRKKLTLQELSKSVPRYGQKGDCELISFRNFRWSSRGTEGGECYQVFVLCPFCKKAKTVWEHQKCPYHMGNSNGCGHYFSLA